MQVLYGNLENSGMTEPSEWSSLYLTILSQNRSAFIGWSLFANGVALNHDESFVLVNETWRGHVRRYWLSGPNEGQTDIFATFAII